MLDKKRMAPGTRLRVGPVKGTFGLRDYMMMTEHAGSVFEGSRRIFAGEELVVVEGPKRRTSGINTAIVEHAGVQGHIYWLELRSSCFYVEDERLRL